MESASYDGDEFVREHPHTQKWDVNSVFPVLHLVRDIVHFQLRKLCHTHPECQLH